MYENSANTGQAVKPKESLAEDTEVLSAVPENQDSSLEVQEILDESGEAISQTQASPQDIPEEKSGKLLFIDLNSVKEYLKQRFSEGIKNGENVEADGCGHISHYCRNYSADNGPDDSWSWYHPLLVYGMVRCG